MRQIGLLFGFFVLLSGCQSKDANVEETPSPIILEKGRDDSMVIIPSPEKGKPVQVPVDLSKLPSQVETFNVDYKVLRSGTNSPFFGGGIIRNKADLSLLGSTQNDFGANVDFSKQAIVVAQAGSFPTGGYSISLISAILKEKKLYMTFYVTSPAPDVAVTMAFTKPYMAVLVDVPSDVEIDVNIIGASSSRPETRLSLE